MKNPLSRNSFCIVLLSLIYAGCASTPSGQTDANELPVMEHASGQIDSSPAEAEKPVTAESSLLSNANDSTKLEDYSKAIVLLERAIRLSPRDPNLWIRLSQGYLNNKNFELAEQYARKAIVLSKQDKETQRRAWLQLANVFEKTGKPKEAEKLRKTYRYRTG